MTLRWIMDWRSGFGLVCSLSWSHGWTCNNILFLLQSMWDGTAPLVLSLYGLYGALAQLIRAPALQAGGHEFESHTLHHH